MMSEEIITLALKHHTLQAISHCIVRPINVVCKGQITTSNPWLAMAVVKMLIWGER